MDKLRAIQIFMKIAEAGSLTGAAARLGVSLTAVVRSLAALEEGLGVRLMQRTTRRLTLTEEGRSYLAGCERVMTALDDAEAALSHSQAMPVGVLRLTGPVMFGRKHIAPVLVDFLAAHPGMRAEMLFLDRVVDLVEEGMDLAVRIGPLGDSPLAAVAVGQAQRVLCASPAYLARCGVPEHPDDLVRHACIRFSGIARDGSWTFMIDGHIIRAPLQPLISVNQIDPAIEACLQGLGCGLFLDYQVKEALADGRLQRLLPSFETPPVPISLLYAPSRLLPLRVRAFITWAVPRLRARLDPRTS